MISQELARELKVAQLPWRPRRGDLVMDRLNVPFLVLRDGTDDAGGVEIDTGEGVERKGTSVFMLSWTFEPAKSSRNAEKRKEVDKKRVRALEMIRPIIIEEALLNQVALNTEDRKHQAQQCSDHPNALATAHQLRARHGMHEMVDRHG